MPSPAEFKDLLAPAAAVAAGGYLLGAIPFGFLVARARGVNIFEVGSKSPGATNVRRVLGSGPGNVVFALDALKGGAAAALPLLLALLQSGAAAASGQGEPGAVASALGIGGILGYVGLAFAMTGHSYSCFTGFRGGKGVATAAGGLLVLMPYALAVAGAVWAVVFFASRFVSLASILAAVSLPLAAALLHGGAVAVTVTALIALFVVVRHRSNIVRLLSGTENRFERRKPDDREDGE
jgi:glycerol-3-phosphate acyltransferase PlsY